MWGGMECTINRVGDTYFDQLNESVHYGRDGDIIFFTGLGLRKIRYQVLWQNHQPLKNYLTDWDETLLSQYLQFT
jgi:dTDP-4-dehydrorhamnose reductase